MQTQTETAELVYEQTTHGAHESTGKSFSRTVTIRHTGVVTGESPRTFETDEYDGVFTIHHDGQVTYEPGEGIRGMEYEVGVNGQIGARDEGGDD